ncbi:MAG: Gfo/Idh/MocA family oxidoreductase [Myxococcota bacterium]|nr:Gfo/Idh/MocA family oxidoreductase [Myxococcota bacterium]
MHLHLYGYGSMGRLHAKKLEKHADVSVDIIDPPKGYAPSTKRCDAAIVATPGQTHCAIAEPLLRQGIPVLLEKPIASSAKDAQRLSQYPTLCVGHIERFSPVWERCKSARPRFVQTERLAPFSGRGTDSSVLLDIMIHDLELCLHFFPGELLDVRGIGISVCSSTYDIVNARLEFPSGVAQLSASRVSRVPHRTMRLFGTEDYWSCDFKNRTLHRMEWSKGDLAGASVPLSSVDPLEQEQAAFLRFVRDGTPFPCSATTAARAVSLAEAIEATL